eukprot:1144453-Pelagomonas_calceolata.AAC.7
MSKEVKPDQVMGYLNELFTAFDALVDTYEIYKVGVESALWGVEVKGKGRMDTFIWDPEEDSSYTMPPDMAAAIALAKVGEGVTGGCAPKNGNL